MIKTAVPALDRSTAIIDFVGGQHTPPTAAEITKQLDIPRSSGHTLLAALVTQGLLHKNPEQRYTLGARIMHWGSTFLSQKNIVTTFQNDIVTSPELLPFSLTLTFREGREVVCMACRNGTAPLGFTFSVGLRLPAGFAATGKAMLSTLPNSAVKSLYQRYWHEAMTPYSIDSCKTLLDELDDTRKRGYSIDDRQIRDGMYCIGVPIFDHNNEAHHGIALSMQKAEATPALISTLGEALNQFANELSRQMGAKISD